MKITVTQKHINSGLRGSCTKDPVGLALKDAGLVDIWVSPTQLRYRLSNGDLVWTPIPENVEAFIRNFDNNRHTEAFEFELEG